MAKRKQLKTNKPDRFADPACSLPRKPAVSSWRKLDKYVGYGITIGWGDGPPMEGVYLGRDSNYFKEGMLLLKDWSIMHFDGPDQVISIVGKLQIDVEG